MSRTTQTAPAGWYPDPTARFPQRYWDGLQWSATVGSEAAPIADPLGTPVFAEPPRERADPVQVGVWAQSHRRALAVGGAVAATILLVVGSVVTVNQRIDQVRDDVAAEQKSKFDKTTKEQNKALGDAKDQLDQFETDMSDLQQRLDDVEAGQAIDQIDPSGGFPTDGSGPLSAPCDLLTPADIGFLIGAAVAVEPDPSDDFECLMSTAPGPEGTSVVVFSDTLFGPLDETMLPLFNEALVPLPVGDEALGSVAFGVAHGAAAKDGLVVEVIVFGGSAPLTIEQLQGLLTVAVGRLH